jgi:hypothetical protein
MPLADQLFELTRAAEQMQQGMYAMTLGIDYRQLVRFELLTRGITGHADGHRERHVADGYAPTQEQFDYCRQFVVTVALRLSELDVQAVRAAALMAAGACGCSAGGVISVTSSGWGGPAGLDMPTQWQNGDRCFTPCGGNVWFPLVPARRRRASSEPPADRPFRPGREPAGLFV